MPAAPRATKKSKAPKGPRERRGQAWLASRLRVSQQRISELVREGRIPRKLEYSEADAQAAAIHLAQARAENNASSADAGDGESAEDVLKSLSKNPEKIAKIKLLIERTAKIKLERELLAGVYVKKEDVGKEATAKVYSVRVRMQELAQRAHLLVGKAELEISRILEDWMREICDYYAGGGN